MKFKQNYKVLFHDTDTSGTIYPARLFMFLQETAPGHTDSGGCAPEIMIERDGGCFWLTRICVSIMEDIRAGDELEVYTFATNDSRGFSFNRSFEAYRNGIKVCEAHSVWALMHLSDMRPIPVKDFNIDLGLEDPVKPSAPLHARIPKDIPLKESGEHTVFYRDIDYNGHLNSIKYIEHMLNFLPLDIFRSHTIHRVEVSYSLECFYRELLSVFMDKNADTHEYDVEIRKPAGEVACRAKIIFKPKQ